MKNLTTTLLLTSSIVLNSSLQICLAAMPSGLVSTTVTDPTNLVWDISSVSLLQDLDFSIDDAEEDETVDIAFPAPFEQTGAGKFVGSGETVMNVDSPIYVGPVDAVYKVTGGITAKAGVAKVMYNASARGLAFAGGQSATLIGAFGLKVQIDALNQLASGFYTASGTAPGYGSVKETAEIDIPWDSLLLEAGDGSWTVEMTLANDGVKKIMGFGNVTLSSGTEYDFIVKGNYKAKTDTSLLVLSPVEGSKGSALKISMVGSDVTAIQGKISGQMVKVAP